MSFPLCQCPQCDFSQAQRNHGGGPYPNQKHGFYSPGESLVPLPRFCVGVGNNCGRVIFPKPFRHESDLCDVCISRIRAHEPCSFVNDNINGDASQIPRFTQSGGFPHELHPNRLREPGGSNYVPLAPSTMRPGRPPIPSRYIPHPVYFQQPQPIIPHPVYFQQPQPISHAQTESNRMRSTFIPYRPGVFAGPSQRVSDRSILSNTGYPTTSLPYGIAAQDWQPTLQLRSLNCEKCRVFMSSHLVGNGRVCSACLSDHRAQQLAISAKPESPFPNHDSFKHRDVIDLTGNEGDGPGLTTDTISTVNRSAPSNRIEIRQPSPQQGPSSVQSRPSKRQRIYEDGRNAFTESDKSVDEPTITAEGNVSKICSTSGCDQTIPVESCGSRCISCVKLDWKSIKAGFKTSRPRHERGAGNTFPSALAKSTEAKRRKSVTWSDTVTIASRDGTITQCLARDVEEDYLPVSSDSVQGGDPPIGVDTIGDEASKMDVVSTTETRLGEAPRMTEKQEVRLEPLEKSIASATGWDSDLSELTESESDSSDDSPQKSAPTGLKIRIPARSSVVFSRKCRNPRCSQVLATDYTGKTCMVCRVHHRQMQQRRKNLHDDDDITMLGEEPPKLIPNARLCSARECTHFIPPQEEYKFKRCSLCRLYQEEWRLLRRAPTHQSDSTKPPVDVKKIYDSFRFLRVRSPSPGRCPSLDCGLFHEDQSTSCRQCVSRRAKLMKRAGIQEEPKDVTAKQDKPLPELNIYPQYICYAFLLSDFEGRLKAFLKSQSIFFLFRTHHPPLNDTKSLFSFDGEYSVVALDFDVVGRKTKIDIRGLKTKKDLESIEGLKFSPKRLISILEGGGIAIRFLCTYQASILQPEPVVDKNVMSVSEKMKPMTGELEIAVFPDQSHHCLPGEKTIIRFRLLG